MNRYQKYLGPEPTRVSNSPSNRNGSRTPSRDLKSYSRILQRNQRSSSTSVRHSGSGSASESSDDVSRVAKSTITRSSKRQVARREVPGTISWAEAEKSLEAIDPVLHAGLLKDAKAAGEPISERSSALEIVLHKIHNQSEPSDHGESYMPVAKNVVDRYPAVSTSPETTGCTQKTGSVACATTMSNSQSHLESVSADNPRGSLLKQAAGELASATLLDEFTPNAVNPTYAFSDDEETHSRGLEADVRKQGLITAAALSRTRNMCTSPPLSVKARSCYTISNRLAKPVKSPPQSQATSSKLVLPSIPRTPARPALKTQKRNCNQNPDFDDGWDELGMSPQDLLLLPRSSICTLVH